MEADRARCGSLGRLGPANSDETALTPDRMKERLLEPSDGFSVVEVAEPAALTALSRRGGEVEGREDVACTWSSSTATDPPGRGSGYRSLSTDLSRETQVTG